MRNRASVVLAALTSACVAVGVFTTAAVTTPHAPEPQDSRTAAVPARQL